MEKHKEMLEQYCKFPFTYVCMSNEKIDDIYTIPYELMINEKLTNNNILNRLIYMYGCKSCSLFLVTV